MRSIWHDAMTGFMAAAFIPPPRHTAHPEKRIRRPVKVLARRRFLQLAAGAAVLPAIPRIAAAQAYPSRPITMIVPAAAGGPTDVVGRIMGERMRSSLGQPVIIENVSGADSSIGVGRAARARPDGYTIDIGSTSTHVLNGALFSLPYSVFE